MMDWATLFLIFVGINGAISIVVLAVFAAWAILDRNDPNESEVHQSKPIE